MSTKTQPIIAAEAATQKIEKIIIAHRKYFSDWRSKNFEKNTIYSEQKQDAEIVSASAA